MCVHREIYDVICEKPGITTWFVAKELKQLYTTVSRRLNHLELHGFLVSEDMYGGLYPFREIEPEEAHSAWQQVRRGR